MLYTGKLYRAELYQDNAWPYTNVSEIYQIDKDRFPGKKLVVTNGHWCTGVDPCPWYKIDGEWLATTDDLLAEDQYSCYGLTWDTEPAATKRPAWIVAGPSGNTNAVLDNFICTIPVIMNGEVVDYSWQKPNVKRECNRTWWGFNQNGESVIEVTTTGYTLDAIVQRMVSLDIVDGIVLDGSGSSQWCDGDTWYKGSDGRRVYEFLLLWFDEENDESSKEATMENSPLVNYTKISPHRRTRTASISKITIHHMACVSTVEQCGAGFSASRAASSNYGIDSNGRVGMYVEEKDRAFTSSSTLNDNMAVTIEVSNSQKGGDWPVSDEAYSKLLDLCEDICRRNGIKKLNFTGDAVGNLTYHSMFAATVCPGPYLRERFPDIAAEVNRRLGVSEAIVDTTPEPEPEPVITKPKETVTIYRAMEALQSKQIAAFGDEKYAEEYRKKMEAAGRNVYIVKVEK